MKWKIIGTFLVIAFLFIVRIMFFSPEPIPVDPIVSNTPTAHPTPFLSSVPYGLSIRIVHKGQNLFIHAVEITEKNTVQLIGNFEEKEMGSILSEKYGCSTAVNGGFYQKNGTPLGLFVSEGSTSGRRITSNLVNGFFWQTKQGKWDIGAETPGSVDSVDFILQSGPYIKVQSNPLSLVTDEYARRSLIGKDRIGRLYMIAVVEAQNSFEGPLLADIPPIFVQEQVQKIIPFTILLNLDGGSASFFYSRGDEGTFSLFELLPVGSILCMKPLDK